MCSDLKSNVLMYKHIRLCLLCVLCKYHSDTFKKGHALKKKNIFSPTLIKIQPCHLPSEVTILCSESVFFKKRFWLNFCLFVYLMKRHASQNVTPQYIACILYIYIYIYIYIMYIFLHTQTRQGI
jgi:hypothetical protein